MGTAWSFVITLTVSRRAGGVTPGRRSGRAAPRGRRAGTPAGRAGGARRRRPAPRRRGRARPAARRGGGARCRRAGRPGCASWAAGGPRPGRRLRSAETISVAGAAVARAVLDGDDALVVEGVGDHRRVRRQDPHVVDGDAPAVAVEQVEGALGGRRHLAHRQHAQRPVAARPARRPPAPRRPGRRGAGGSVLGNRMALGVDIDSAVASMPGDLLGASRARRPSCWGWPGTAPGPAGRGGSGRRRR